MQLSFLKIFSTVVILFTTSLPGFAQDMLARQAPIDRKMKAVDTLTLKNLIHREQAASPAADLYEDWDNVYAHKATQLPETFRIDLRGFCMPTKSRVVTSNFGYRASFGRQHKGLDIKVYIGDTIRAAFSGKVRIVRYEGGGYGKYIVIRHQNGLETIYGHLSAQLVEENQNVKAGDVIGLGGNTGRSTGSHLHFETRLCGVALDPTLLFDFRNQDVTGDFYVFHRDTYMAESRESSRLRGKIGNGGYTREQVTGEEVPEAEAAVASNYQPASSEPRYHKVAKGETLFSIAQKRGITVDELCRINHIKKAKKVRVGQILRLS